MSQVIDQESLEANPEFLLEKLNPILTHSLSSLTKCIENYRNLVVESSEMVNTDLKQPIETLIGIKTQILGNFSLLIEKILASKDLKVTLKRTSNFDIFRTFGIEVFPADKDVLVNSNSLVISRSNFVGAEETLIVMNNQGIDDLKKINMVIKDSNSIGVYMTYFDERNLIDEVLSQNKKNISSLLLIKYPTDIQRSPLSKIYAINLHSNFELLRNIVLSILFWCFNNSSSPDMIRRSARESVDATLYEEAVSSLRELLDIDPYDVSALVDLGYIQYTIGDNLSSIESNERVLEVDNTQLEAWYNRGLAYENLDRFEEALASFNEAISLNPLDEAYWFGRARCQRRLRKFLEAHKSIDYVFTIRPENYKAWAERARIFWEQRDDIQAISSMKSAISLNPLDLDYYKDLVFYLNNKALYREAKKVLDEMPSEVQKDQELIDFGKNIMFKLKGSPRSKSTKNSPNSKGSKKRKQEASS